MIRFCILVAAALVVVAPAPAAAQLPEVGVLLVNPRSNLKSLADFVAWAKSSKKPLAYSSSESDLQRIAQTLVKNLGIKAVHVPYRVPTQGILDLIGGHIDFSLVDADDALGQIQGGLVIPLAVARKQRFPRLPDVPTFAEAGYLELISRGPVNSSWPLLTHARH
jgi:tripartite-type tricarboxylate transporter receptor subunit TctC